MKYALATLTLLTVASCDSSDDSRDELRDAAADSGQGGRIDAAARSDAALLDAALDSATGSSDSCSSLPPAAECPAAPCYIDPDRSAQCQLICEARQCYQCRDGEWHAVKVDCGRKPDAGAR